jgi:hypothetical protein
MKNYRPFFFYLAVFLLAASGLMLEVGLTRIFSATIWYHYSFIAISVALLGWGFGGLTLSALKGMNLLKSSTTALGLLCLLYALAIPTSLGLMVQTPFSPERLTFYFLATVVPFLLAGMAVAMAFDLFREAPNRLYGADLVGASLGAVMVIAALSGLGGERTILALAILPLLALLSLAAYQRGAVNPPSTGKAGSSGSNRGANPDSPPDTPHRGNFSSKYEEVTDRGYSTMQRGLVIAGIVLMAAVACVLIFYDDAFQIRNAPTKGLYQQLAEETGERRIAMTRWNSYSRIDALEGLPPPLLARLFIDSDAWTDVHSWNGTVEGLERVKSEFRYLPYRLIDEPKILVIGPGGGVDVLLGIAAESESVTAVEMNPIMIDFVRHYGQRAGDLYDHPKVKVVLEEGRNFIRRSSEKFDIILLGFVDSWASVSSGGLALSENYLYTTDAFRDFSEHLTDRGMLVFIRWQVDIPRMVSNAVVLFGSAEKAGDHLAILLEKRPQSDQPTAMIFMLKKEKFTEVETSVLAKLSQGNFHVHIPGLTSESPYGDLFSGRMTTAEFYEKFDTKVDPVFDDRPFYFATEKPYGIPAFVLRFFKKLSLPLGAICLITVGTAIFRSSSSERRRGSTAAATAYFGSLGVGYIVIELALVQRLILLLGHPAFTLSVILFSLLVSSGIGSWVSGRAREESPYGDRWIRRACFAVAGLGLVYLILLPPVVRFCLPLPLFVRIVSVVVLIFPLGFVMGMPFPMGLRATTSWSSNGPPLFWGLNGIASVAGSFVAVFFGMVFGFGAVMAVGSFFYLIAAMAAFLIVPQRLQITSSRD